jgi:triosephosphate isomerase
MSSAARRVFIGGNWKCNGSLSFVNSHSQFLNTIAFDSKKCQVIVSPMSIHLHQVKSILTNGIEVSAQNVSMRKEGAYTGEVAAKHLVDLGVRWTLVGHSERRTLFGESDDVVGAKVKIALENQVNVIACLGETLSERKANQTMNVCFRQLEAITKNVSNWRNCVLAYEPVWAIGTGEAATKEQAQEVHANLREWLRNNVSDEVANLVQIIYGGM